MIKLLQQGILNNPHYLTNSLYIEPERNTKMHTETFGLPDSSLHREDDPSEGGP